MRQFTRPLSRSAGRRRDGQIAACESPAVDFMQDEVEHPTDEREPIGAREDALAYFGAVLVLVGVIRVGDDVSVRVDGGRGGGG